jgi:hypothetical protein
LVTVRAVNEGESLPPGAQIQLKLIPAGAQAGGRFEGVTDAHGVATVTYTHPGTMAFTANTAAVTVLNPAGAAVPGACALCVIKTGPNPGSVPLDGNQFTYPPATRPAPPQYAIECTVTGAAGAGLPGHVVRFDFDRNNQYDQTLIAKVTPDLTSVFPLPFLTAAHAHAIANSVLHHPMICKIGFSLGGILLARKMFGWIKPLDLLLAWIDQRTSRDHSGEVVEREELIRILLEFAAGEGAGKLQDPIVRQALVDSLRMNGIPNPGKSLADIRAEAQRLEREKPNAAAHVRAAEAIITAAKSDFVGRVNGWFDQTMDRVSQRYGMQARIVTVLGALLVAFSIQIDSLDLLRRLSVNDKLRDSLLNEAKAQQDRIDKLNSQNQPQQNKDELDAAKGVRDEIQANLAKLRAPQMAILPDHFIWQQVPQAHLVRNPTWRAPYPSRFELVLGSGSYVVTPRWRRDVLVDLEAAIKDAKAPLSTSIEAGEDSYLLTSTGAGPVTLRGANGAELVTPLVDLASARLEFNPQWSDPLDVHLCLMLDERPCIPIAVNAPRIGVAEALQKALAPVTSVTVSGEDKGLRITALEPRVRRIALLYDASDPFSNVLDDTERITRTGTVTKAVVEREHLTLPPGAKPFRTDALLLTSYRLGALELRYTPTRPETNILNEPARADWGTVAWLMQPQLWGILLSWLLLSLGAPFWYDTLKDLLKLRSSLASKEEDQRKDRQADTAPAKP